MKNLMNTWFKKNYFLNRDQYKAIVKIIEDLTK